MKRSISKKQTEKDSLVTGNFRWTNAKVAMPYILWPFPHEFSLLLLDVIYREETLMNVIHAVTKNVRSIGFTLLLAVILIYLFSFGGFLLFQNDFTIEASF